MILNFNRYSKNEKYNDISNANEIYIILYDKFQLYSFLKQIDLSDFTISSYITEYNNKLFPFYLFINLVTLEVKYAEQSDMEGYDDISQSTIFDNVLNRKFTIYDIYILKDIIKYKRINIPSYKSKEKPKRVLENNNYKYKYRDIILQVNNDYDVKYFYDFFKNMNYTVIESSTKITSFPNYIFIENINKCRENKCIYNIYLSDTPSYEKLLKYIEKDQKIYNINNLNLINHIIQTGYESPTYHAKQKTNRVLESFKNLNDNYNYNCIVIKVDNIQEYKYIYKIIKDLNINTINIDYLKEDIESGNKCYIRIYMEYDNVLYSSGSKIENLELYSKDDGFKYDKIYNVKDIKKQTLINILKHGIDKPFYLPKQKINRILESNQYKYSCIVFKINDENENIIAQENLFIFDFYWNSDKSLKSFNVDKYPIYLFADNNNKRRFLSYMDQTNEYVLNYIKRCNRYNDEKIYEKIFNYDDTKYVMELLKHGTDKPFYLPKQKINRIIESNNFDIEYIKKMLNDAPYDVLYYRHHNNEQYYNKFNEILKKYPFFDKGYDGDIEYDDMFGKYYFFTLKNIDNWEQLSIYESPGENETLLEDYPNIKFSEMIVNPNELDKILYNLIGSKPNYNPRKKSERIIENRELVNELWHFCDDQDNVKLITKSYNINYPRFNIGDNVIFKNNALNIHLKDTRHIYDMNQDDMNWISNNSIKKKIFKITKLAYRYENDLWLLKVNDINYISINACESPNYIPKQKINRIL